MRGHFRPLNPSKEETIMARMPKSITCMLPEGAKLEIVIPALRVAMAVGAITSRCVSVLSHTGKPLAFVDSQLTFDSHPELKAPETDDADSDK